MLYYYFHFPDCFDVTEGKNGSVKYRLSNDTIKFHNLAFQTEQCFQNNSRVIIYDSYQEVRLLSHIRLILSVKYMQVCCVSPLEVGIPGDNYLCACVLFFARRIELYLLCQNAFKGTSRISSVKSCIYHPEILSHSRGCRKSGSNLRFR